MHLRNIGWEGARLDQLPPGASPGRVARVDRGRLTVLTADGERRVHPAAALHGAGGGATGGAAPAVGDWVALRGELAVAVLPRRSAFTRTTAGRSSAAQVVAANVDVVLVVDSLSGPFRPRRIERYLAVAWSSGAAPVVVLTKADLCDDAVAALELVAENAPGVEVLAVSSVTGAGIAAVEELIGPGRTAAVVGPSGVGKSTLVNALAGETLAVTREIRGDGRGRHTTTARELHVLPGGGLLVDTPGMRELALHDDEDGVATAYADITAVAEECRFRDCAHRTEPGCAVAAAIDAGRLDPARLLAWRKLEAEARRQLLRVDARARARDKAQLRSLHRALRERPVRGR